MVFWKRPSGVVDFGPESSRQTLFSPIFRSSLVPSVAACFRTCIPGTDLQPCLSRDSSSTIPGEYYFWLGKGIVRFTFLVGNPFEPFMCQCYWVEDTRYTVFWNVFNHNSTSKIRQSMLVLRQFSRPLTLFATVAGRGGNTWMNTDKLYWPALSRERGNEAVHGLCIP